jgi:T5SS/PEP-CTERM-associated repeat protein
LGELNVVGDFTNGARTLLTLSGATGPMSAPTVQIGNEGTGYFNVSGGGTVNLTSTQSDMSIGVGTTGVGYVTISDPFSLLTVNENLTVGDDGMGSLEVLNGAWVRTLSTSLSRSITIGSSATSVGTMVVDGLGSVLTAGSNLNVGGAGQGTLAISNQAIVNVTNVTNRKITVGPLGRIELSSGGKLVGLSTTVNGYLGGSGTVSGIVSYLESSEMTVGAGDLLKFSGDVTSNGAFTIDQGEVQFLGNFDNAGTDLLDTPGRITLENGTIRFYEPLINEGVISSSHGNNALHGDILNAGHIYVAGDSVATFYDPFIDLGGTVDVLHGSTALFLTDLTFQTSSTLQLSVGLDENMMDDSSQVSVAGEATLGGELMINLPGNYTPELGQSFTLITASDGIVGTFDSMTLPEIPGGLEFGVLYDANSVRLEIQIEQASIGLDGDYNNNGEVDAADYTVWRDALNSGSGFLLNDHTPGIVDESDFLYWRAHYGEIALFGAGAGADPVPEPSSACLASLMFLGLFSGIFGRTRL